MCLQNLTYSQINRPQALMQHRAGAIVEKITTLFCPFITFLVSPGVLVYLKVIFGIEAYLVEKQMTNNDSKLIYISTD